MSGRIMLDAPPQEPEEHPAPVPEIPPPPEPTPPEPPPTELPPAKEAKEGEAQSDGPPPDWKARIDRLTREKYEARRQAEDYQRQIQNWQQQQRQAQQPPAQGDAEERALQRFQAQQAEREFNAACNEVFRKGSADYSDFGDAVSALNAVGFGNRPDALAAISALPEGHHVYRALAQDLDNAARVLAMPPMHMAMELARMAQGHGQNGAAPVTPPAPVTRAPAPLRPVGGNSARPEQRLDQIKDMGDWIRRRDRDTAAGSSRIRR